MHYSGIDPHKDNCYITTRDESGDIANRTRVKNIEEDILNYFKSIGLNHRAVVESTNSWYWLNDLLESNNIHLELAHAKYIKAIEHAKVKTDKIDPVKISIEYACK
jgi:hypothetical protein